MKRIDLSHMPAFVRSGNLTPITEDITRYLVTLAETETERYIQVPSIIRLASLFRCSPFEVCRVLEKLRYKNFDFQFDHMDSPLLIYPPALPKKQPVLPVA